MSDKKDLVVKMTINSSDFDNGLKNAKSQMKQTEKTATTAGSSMKAVFGKVAIAIAAVGTAMETLKKVMRGTEQGADAMDRSMRMLTTSTDKFFQSLSNGSMKEFLDGLSDIAANAKEAYNALDKLGTMKMWGSARISQLQAQIAEDRVIVNNANTSESDRTAAQERIALNMEKINALSGNLADATLTAMTAKLREMSGTGKDYVTDEMLKSFVDMFEQGTLSESAQNYLQQHSHQELRSYVAGFNQEGIMPYKQEYYERVWDSESSRWIWNAMQNLATITEGEGGWADYYKLMAEEATQRIQVANQANKANTLLNKGSGTGSSVGGSKSAGLTWEQQQEMMRRSGFFWALNSDKEKDSQIIPLEELIEDEEIIEEETDNLVASILARRDAMVELAKETAAAITAASALGSAFMSIGQIAGDDMFGNIASGLGNIVAQASSTISALMALAGAETIEGLAETFSSAPPYTKIALTATALAGILSMIASAKSAFAGSYANGGIVGGNSYSGDKLWARVNSGEMIIPYNDWHNSGTGSGQVKFVIEGSQLKGVLDNYESIQNM